MTTLHNILMGLALLALTYVAACLGGCDDASSRKLQDNTVLPSERAKHINYGKP